MAVGKYLGPRFHIMNWSIYCMFIFYHPPCAFISIFYLTTDCLNLALTSDVFIGSRNLPKLHVKPNPFYIRLFAQGLPMAMARGHDGLEAPSPPTPCHSLSLFLIVCTPQGLLMARARLFCPPPAPCPPRPPSLPSALSYVALCHSLSLLIIVCTRSVNGKSSCSMSSCCMSSSAPQFACIPSLLFVIVIRYCFHKVCQWQELLLLLNDDVLLSLLQVPQHPNLPV